ncbi:tumor necrosis factor ligand superfamily member 8 [Elgaria multicarinata webbii]|uniref:tumor necrosis factor ligand superfamily member 8 n=1 Tax=Elgaria multicarinata webbii TaxID=159646 RepID=UPI002FCD4FE4
MNYQLEQKPFLAVNCPQEVARDMTEESVTRQLSAPIHTFVYFVIAVLTLCLLAALGVIVVLVLQRTGSTAQCDGQRTELQVTETKPVADEKAAAHLQALKPINQSQLKWNSEGILHNIQWADENLVIQMTGAYFIYCHLYFYKAKCQNDVIDIKITLLVNNVARKEMVVNLCSSQELCEGINRDSFISLLVELNKGDLIAVHVDPFRYLDVDTFPKNNVLAAFKYTGEEEQSYFINRVPAASEMPMGSPPQQVALGCPEVTVPLQEWTAAEEGYRWGKRQGQGAVRKLWCLVIFCLLFELFLALPVLYLLDKNLRSTQDQAGGCRRPDPSQGERAGQQERYVRRPTPLAARMRRRRSFIEGRRGRLLPFAFVLQVLKNT